MVNYYTTENCLVRNVSRMLCAAAFLLMAFTFANAQTCPDPGGGINDQGLDFTTASTATLYPESLPSGQSGFTRSTVGRMRNLSPVTTIFPSNVITLNPVLSNGHTGSVVLFFRNLWFGDAPNAELKIFQGTSTGGTLLATINAADSTTYTQTSASYTGPITLQFQSPVAGTSGNFDIHIRYWTGDQVFQSGFGRLAAVWTDFMQPNSATFIDDQRTTIPGVGSTLNTNPIAIARFDGNRQLISSELAFCMDSPLTNVGYGWGDYPGQTTFSYETDYDTNNDGTVDAADQLRTARLGWLMANRTTVPINQLQQVNFQTHSVVEDTHGAANAAIPSLPTPAEPTFSISAPAGAAAPGSAQTFTVTFDMAGSYPKRLKLVVPAGVTVGSVTGSGVTYSGGYIEFASLPGNATIQATSATSQTAQLQVLYDETGFYNVTNFLIFVPCKGPTFQRFVGFKQGEVTNPHREASATWANIDLDYGDLPDTYATLAASNGASHAITAYNATTHTASLMLGSQIDSDADGAASTVATGDDLAGVDDEDALTQFPVLVPGSTTYTVTLPVTNTTGATATVKGWIDFNKDGIFGSGEDATAAVSDGGTSVTLTWSGFPAVANFGYLYARFRIASAAAEIALPTGAANSGEVEDYRLFISRTVAGSVFNDINRNTRIDSGEPFTSLPAPMYVYMVQNNIIVDAATVAANGSYLLLAPAGQSSTLQLSTVQYPIGTDVTSTPINRTPPSGWATSGENGSGNNTGSGDLSPDGILSVTVTTTSLVQRNFGIRYQSAGTSGGSDICATDTSILPLADFIQGEDAGGTWSYVSGSGITFDAAAGTIQLTNSATTSTYRYDIPATGGNPGSFSIATVSVRPVPVTHQSITICQGESICIFNPAGTARTIDPQEQICHNASGVYSDTLVGASHFGCDSIVVTTLTVVPTPNAGTDGAITACTNDATPVDLFSLITGEQAGGTWTRLTGTGGTFDAATGTFTPAVGATTSTFSYTIAGAGSCPEDVSVATVNLNTCSVQISGTIFNDANGLFGTPVNTVDGTPIQIADGMPLHANLFTAGGVFVASVPVDASGNYSFSVSPGTDYVVTVSTTAATTGSAPAGSVGLPTGWINTGEFVGSGAGNDLAPNGTLTVSVGFSSVTNANFGLDRQPNSNNVTHILTTDPIPNQEILLDGADAPLMNGSDPEDGTYSGGSATPGNDPKGVVITSLPTNGQLWYYGFGAPVVVSASDVTNGTLFADPSLFTVVLTGAGYTSTSFNYAYVDAAGVADPTPATYLISWSKPLPVTLVSFDVTTENKTASLKWVTTSETNSKGFEIQRSANASDWTKIGFVEAQSQGATVTSKLVYDFTDADPLSGVNYYRLKMVDRDATFAYSQVRAIRVDGANAMVLYPNPVVQGKLTIDVANAGAYHAEIVDVAGITVLTQSLAKTRELNVNRLASGLYVLRITSANGDVQTKPFVVK